MNILHRFFIFLIFLLFPFFSQATVVINEIGWQGYLGDSSNEWIELYNQSSDAINLEGWEIFEAGGSVKIMTFSSSLLMSNSTLIIPPDGYFLICRTNNFLGNCDITGSFGGNGLVNTGEHLVLKNNNEQVDSVDFSSGWGMDSSSEGSLSRFGDDWREGVATPKATNLEVGENNSEDEQEENDDNLQEDESNTTQNQVRSSKTDVIKRERKATIHASQFAFVGIPVEVTSYLTDTDGDEIKRGIYAWNMGDGSVFYRPDKEPVQYTYHYPGEYLISLTYSEGTFGRKVEEIKPTLSVQHVISVTDKTLVFETVHNDGSITLKNNSSQTLPVADWKLGNTAQSFTVPKQTFVRAGKTITFPASVTGFSYGIFSLFNPSGNLVDTSIKISEVETKDFEGTTSEVLSNANEGVYNTPLEELVDFNEYLNKENSVLSSTFSQQKTLYVGMFSMIIVLIVIIIWILFTYKKSPEDTVREYEVVEE